MVFEIKARECEVTSMMSEHLADVAVPNVMQYARSKADTFFRHVHTFYFNITMLVGCCENVGLYPVKAGWEGENWVVLSTRKTKCLVPQISYRQQ